VEAMNVFKDYGRVQLVKREDLETLLYGWYDGREFIISERSSRMREDTIVLNRQWHEFRRLFGLPHKGAPTWKRGMWRGLNGQSG
jgi:hypothetical protein